MVVAGVASGVMESEEPRLIRPNTVSFPEWAQPTEAVELLNEPHCPGDAHWLPPCRTLRFGTQRDYEPVVGELKTVFEAYGWTAQFEPHDMSLHATDPDGLRCILYYNEDWQPPRTREADDLTKRAGFPVLITVVFDGCGAQFGS